MSRGRSQVEMIDAARSGPLTKTAAAFNALRSAIESGRIAPGQPLRINALMAELGMSPTPIREALRMLQAEGLVAHEPHRGAVVRTYPVERVDEIYQLRILLESTATRMAAQRVTAPDMHRIERLHRRLATAVRSDKSTDMANLNAAWHRSIYSACGSGFLEEFIDRLWSTLPLQAMWLSSHGAESVKEHQVVLTALSDRDDMAAEVAMRVHLERGWRRHVARLLELSEQDRSAEVAE